MPKVSVELDDLEALVVVSGAIKTIEHLLAQRKHDPFVRPYLELTEVHERLAAEMRNARRAEAGTLIEWDGALTEAELKLLHTVDSGAKHQITPTEKKNVADGLAAKGCVLIGQLAWAVIWPGANAPDLRPNPDAYGIKVTQRGREKLAQKQLV